MGANIRDEVGMRRPETCHIGFIEPEEVRPKMVVIRIEWNADFVVEKQIRLLSALGIVVANQAVQGLPELNVIVEEGALCSLVQICPVVRVRRWANAHTVVKGQQKKKKRGSSGVENVLSSFSPGGFPSEHDRVVKDVNLRWTRRPGSVFLAWIS